MSGNVKCHGGVRQYGSPYSTARFRAICRCGWRGPYTRIMFVAWQGAKNHDPHFPRGSRAEDMP